MYLISCQALATAVRDVHVVSGQDLTVEVAKAKKKQLGITSGFRDFLDIHSYQCHIYHWLDDPK